MSMSAGNGNGNGLAWPDHDTGPTPPPDYAEAQRAERPVRKRMALWDRTKLLVLLGVVWLVFLWSLKSDVVIMSWPDAINETLRTKWWLLALAGVEVLRQLHYFVSERSAGYHHFWTERVFGGIERRTGRLNDWNRYRIARAFKYAVLVAALAVVLGAVFGEAPAAALFGLPGRVLGALPDILRLVLYLVFAVGQFAAIFWFLSRGGVDTYFPDDIKTRFSDVWGQDAVVERVRENTVFLENPEAIEEKGGYVPGGILLWGPPGTGKTLMAEAVAGETAKPYVFVDPGAFTNMFMGVGILKVKALFRKLRKLAVRYGGVIVFFDEADSLGNRGALAQGGWQGSKAPAPWSASGCHGPSYLSAPATSALVHDSLSNGTAPSTGTAFSNGTEPPRRARDRIVMGGMGGGGMGTLQALLTELSGLKKPRGFMNRVVRRTLGMRPKPPPKYRMLVMMATNMPQSLDEALLRPGRIDRIYKVGYPTKDGRRRTFEGYLAKVSHGLRDDEVDKLATITRYATGATIKDMVNEALINAIRDGRDSITWADMMEAKRLKDLGLPEGLEYSERERHATAVHEACHAITAHRVRRHMTIDLATIEGRGSILGMVSSVKPEDEFSTWRSEYQADIMVAIASLAGERMFFGGDSTNGVSSDLRQATTVATVMQAYVGMGTTIASHAVTTEHGVGAVRQPGRAGGGERAPISDSLSQRIEELLVTLYDRAEKLLAENRLEVLAVAHALETHKTLDGEDVVAIIDGYQGPLVDGRAYHTPEFARLAEDYHARVVSAHQQGLKVDVPLPALTPPDPYSDAPGSFALTGFERPDY